MITARFEFEIGGVDVAGVNNIIPDNLSMCHGDSIELEFNELVGPKVNVSRLFESSAKW